MDWSKCSWNQKECNQQVQFEFRWTGSWGNHTAPEDERIRYCRSHYMQAMNSSRRTFMHEIVELYLATKEDFFKELVL